MADDLNLVLEAERRGILPEDKRPLLEEARRRGLIEEMPSTLPSAPVSPSQEPITPEWAGRHPELYGLYGAVKESAKPILTGGGAAVGALVGGASGLVTGPAAPVAAPLLAAGGGALGYTMGEEITRAIEELAGERPLSTLPEATTRTVKGLKTGAEMEMGGQLFGGLAKAVRATPTGIKKSFIKAIKPSAAQAPSMKKFADDGYDAMNLILGNQNNLVYHDLQGNPFPNRVPETMDQLDQALQQTKKSVWSSVKTVLKQAGKEGNTITLEPIAKELEIIAKDKSVRTHAPALAKYAKAQAELYRSERYFTPEEAQEALSLINADIHRIYVDPSGYRTSTKRVDAMIANRLRADLDGIMKGLEGTVGTPGKTQFAQLKKDYGSLRTIEEAVRDRARKDLTKGSTEMGGIIDAYTGAEVIGGAITGGSGMVARGSLMLMLNKLHRWFTNPNPMIRRAFKRIEQERLPKTEIPRKLTGAVAGYTMGKLSEGEGE